MLLNTQILGSLVVGGGGIVNYPSVAFGTVITGVIYPFMGKSGGTFKQKPYGSPIEYGRGITHVTTVLYTTGGTAHQLVIARPFNRTHLTAAIAAGTASGAFKPAVDPGKYSTSYKYPITGGLPGLIADNTIAANDYVCIQLDDGSWFLDTIASGTFAGNNLVLTTTFPNNGVGASIGNAVYWYGNITSDKNPANGCVNPTTLMAASGTRAAWQETTCGIVSAFNPGDPLIVYSPNGTATGTFDAVTGFYAAVA